MCIVLPGIPLPPVRTYNGCYTCVGVSICGLGIVVLWFVPQVDDNDVPGPSCASHGDITRFGTTRPHLVI